MAAYAALVSLLKSLKNFIPQQHGHVFQSLQQNVLYLERVFDKFPAQVRKWEEKIHDSANQAESVIDDLVSRTTIWDEDIVKLDKVGACIESIVDEVRRGVESAGRGQDDFFPDKTPFGNQMHENLFGFEHHLTEIRGRLLIHSSELHIVPVVGMGGVGKTSLARALFDDKRIAKHFDLRRWVTVSQTYSTKAILLAILGIEEQSHEMSASVIDLGVKVNGLLYRRRYLIVVDDLWDLNAWDEVKKSLRDDENRSRVLLTTRHQDVARCTKPSGSIYHLQPMDDETSWNLLRYKVFGEEQCPLELVEIGKKIADGCGGLPLAIVVIAGTLTSFNLNQDSWDGIANDMRETIAASDDHLMDILGLSYQHLPHYLRPCFLYASVFSGMKNIKVSTLLKLWVAEGFLNANNTCKDVEETAYECFEELLQRNLFMATEKYYNGRTRVCGIHDLLRDLSQKKAQQEKFLGRNENMVIAARRASFFGEESCQFMSSSQPYLRGVICYSKSNDLLSQFQSCRLLRILHTPYIVRSSFPSQLLRLCHLRYLNLAFSPHDGFKIPSEISKLENLETLSFRFADMEDKSSIIPVEIWNMSKLRHISLFPELDLPAPTREASPLVNLLSLRDIRNFCLTEETVKLIPNVRKLVVSYEIDPTKESWSDYYLNNLCHLTCLEAVKFSSKCNDLEGCKENPVMPCLIFPSSLKILKFRGLRGGSWEDMTRITGSLPNLEFLELSSVVLSGDTWETNEEDLEKLKVLEIRESCLKCWRSKSNSPFPRLEHLVLSLCPDLTELPEGLGDIPTLESIAVDDEQEAIVIWAKQIEEDQVDSGNELLQVSILSISGLTDTAAAILEEHGVDEELAALALDYYRAYGMGVFGKVLDGLGERSGRYGIEESLLAYFQHSDVYLSL